MADTLKRGGLGSEDEPEVPDAFAGSMAKAMEDALNILLAEEENPTVPVDNTRESRDRRTMFLAISRGIIDHLVANQTAFVIRDLADNMIPVKITISNE